MIIVCFLGNPGKKYSKTRHNIGYISGVYFSESRNIPLNKKDFSSVVGYGTIDRIDVALILPQTFMNMSGQPVREAISFYKADPAHLVAVHDDIELPFGEIRVKFGGGHKGHNGLRSIMAETGTAEFHRIRFGVGRPPDERISVSDWVLSDFMEEEIEKIKLLLPAADEMIVKLIRDIATAEAGD